MDKKKMILCDTNIFIDYGEIAQPHPLSIKPYFLLFFQ